MEGSRRGVTRRAAVLGLLTLAVGGNLWPRAPGPRAAPARPAAPAETRAFRMGFTPFPHDITSEAVAQMKSFLRTHSDLIAQHLEGVPWREALQGRPFHPTLREDWEKRRSYTPPGAKVYLALSPGRGDLAPYRAEREGLPVPPELAGRSFDDPLVIRAYLAYCRRAIRFFRPDYLVIGIEVNEIYKASPEKWRAYARLHRAVYRALKRENPGLPVFASFSLHNLLNPTENRAMLQALRELMDANDLVAVSFYPFMGGLSSRVGYAFDWLTRQFDRYRKPYALVETGEAAERLPLPSFGVTIQGSPRLQATYYEAMLAFAQRKKLAFVVSFLYRDYDALWGRIQGSSPETFKAWKDCGLLDEAGRQRPAYAVWRRWSGRKVGTRRPRTGPAPAGSGAREAPRR